MVDAEVADTAVREYLLFIDDAQQLVDEGLVETLRERVDAAEDPLERLVAIAEYERARCPSEDTYREAFVAHARDWAAAHDVPASAFEQLGVPVEVLRAAGIVDDSSTESRPGLRTVEDLKAAIGALPERFVAADLVAAAGGGSPMTVRKALSEAVDDDLIRRLGPVPNWKERGRAPIQYERVG